MNYNLREISTKEFTPFRREVSLFINMPRITKLAIGGFREDSLVAGVSFGYGSRPRHTIQKLFPSLDTKDYLEIGKMCLDDREPKNSESWFLARAISITRKQFPAVKLIFTWADALWGKPGYIYQASKEHVAPAGAPLQVSVIAPLNPNGTTWRL